MPNGPTLTDARLLGIRKVYTDYPIPGRHLHRPKAIGQITLPSGRVVRPESQASESVGSVGARGHLWPFYVTAGAASVRSTGVSPTYQGPLFIERITFAMTNIAGDAGGVSLWSARGAGTAQLNVASTILPGGTQLWDKNTYQTAVSVDADEAAGHFGTNGFFNGATYPLSALINILVPDTGPVTLMISVRAAPGGAILCQGMLSLIENADPFNLPF